MKNLIIILVLITSIFGVDGYKHLKFGISKKKLLTYNVCNFSPTSSQQPGVEVMSCDDLKFGGGYVTAGAFFINNKMLRFVIVPPMNIIVGLSKKLKNKYGPSSSSSPIEDFGLVDRKPNREAYVAFDNDTVYLKLNSDSNRKQSALLMYNSLKYEQLLIKMQRDSISNDDL